MSIAVVALIYSGSGMSMYSDMNVSDRSRYMSYQGALNTVTFLLAYL